MYKIHTVTLCSIWCLCLALFNLILIWRKKNPYKVTNKHALTASSARRASAHCQPHLEAFWEDMAASAVCVRWVSALNSHEINRVQFTWQLYQWRGSGWRRAAVWTVLSLCAGNVTKRKHKHTLSHRGITEWICTITVTWFANALYENRSRTCISYF